MPINKDDKNRPMKTSQKVVALMAKTPKITMQEIADSIGISEATVKDQIKRLKDKGKIRRVGPDKGGYWEVIENKESK